MEIKDAVRSAIGFANGLGLERMETVLLEEVDSSKANGRPVWLITLSTVLPASAANFPALAHVLGDAKRQYKVFAVDKETGNVLSMKIRTLAVPTM